MVVLHHWNERARAAFDIKVTAVAILGTVHASAKRLFEGIETTALIKLISRLLALSSASLKPVLGNGGREGERHGVASQPTKVFFRANKNRWITETVDGNSYRTGIAEKSYRVPLVDFINLRHPSSSIGSDGNVKCSRLLRLGRHVAQTVMRLLISEYQYARSELPELETPGTPKLLSAKTLGDLEQGNAFGFPSTSPYQNPLQYLQRTITEQAIKIQQRLGQPNRQLSVSTKEANGATLEALGLQIRHFGNRTPTVRHSAHFNVHIKEFRNIYMNYSLVSVKKFVPEKGKDGEIYFMDKLYGWMSLHPESYAYILWLIVVSMAFLYNCWVVPLRSTFLFRNQENLSLWFAVDCCADAIYLLDLMVVKPRIMYLLDGFWIHDTKLTTGKYMRKLQFKMDIFSLLPTDLLYLKFGRNSAWLRLPRFLKVSTHVNT
uniref:Ion transport domain-containing protein n=1 Tax=Timema shepardi TaxID=629360 RepID=A0A7R9G4T5_TIMSH|nr:unnamed protein product [Timema shepardi]